MLTYSINFIDAYVYVLSFRYVGHRTDDMNIESAVITNDNYVFSGSTTGELWCWDLISTEVVKRYDHTLHKVLHSISVHPKKDILLTASVNTIKIWGKPDDIPVQTTVEYEDD